MSMKKAHRLLTKAHHQMQKTADREAAERGQPTRATSWALLRCLEAREWASALTKHR